MNVHSFDENDKRIILDESKNHQVMMEWEKEYMKKCIEKLNPFGDVLEVGFGLGYSATSIQNFPIKSYTIIEHDKLTCERIFEWSKRYNHKINIIEDKWENVCNSLQKFDTIFFDDYDVNYIKLTDENLSTPCRNAHFIREMKNNLKDHVRYSFYCALCEDELTSYKGHWENEDIISNYKFNFKSEEFKTVDVPDNCRYIGTKKLYCPVINMKKTMFYS